VLLSRISIRRQITTALPGMDIKNAPIIAFRITGITTYDLHEDEVMDLLKSVEAEIKDRSNKIAIRLEIEPAWPKKHRKSGHATARGGRTLRF